MDKLPPVSKANSVNPKDLIGSQKVSLSKLPAVALVHGAHAMMDGARKYGAYNWRAKKVMASIYVDAALRHITAWFEGEELAGDSGVHHLGHAIACCGILLDAQETGNLVDDRPVDDTNRGNLSNVLARLGAAITARTEVAKAEKSSCGPSSDGAITIRVNGNLMQVTEKALSYYDIVKLAHPGMNTQGVLYSTTVYSKHSPAAIVGPGDIVSLENGMSFTSVFTGAA